MQQKRIVVFHRCLRFGGAQRALIGFANGLSQSGHEVTFVAGSGSSDATRQMGLRPEVNLVILNASNALAQIRALAAHLRMHPPDILLAQWAFSTAHALAAAMPRALAGWSPERGASSSEESLRFSEAAVVQGYLNPLLAEMP